MLTETQADKKTKMMVPLLAEQQDAGFLVKNKIGCVLANA